MDRRTVEHALAVTVGAAVVVGGMIGAGIGFGVEKLRHRHRQSR